MMNFEFCKYRAFYQNEFILRLFQKCYVINEILNGVNIRISPRNYFDLYNRAGKKEEKVRMTIVCYME